MMSPNMKEEVVEPLAEDWKLVVKNGLSDVSSKAFLLPPGSWTLGAHLTLLSLNVLGISSCRVQKLERVVDCGVLVQVLIEVPITALTVGYNMSPGNNIVSDNVMQGSLIPLLHSNEENI